MLLHFLAELNETDTFDLEDDDGIQFKDSAGEDEDIKSRLDNVCAHPQRDSSSPPPPPLARSRDDADPLDPAPAAPREEGAPLLGPHLQPSSLSPSWGRFAEGSAESGDRSLGTKRRSQNKVRGSRPAGPGGPKSTGEAGLAPGGASLRPGARRAACPCGQGDLG